jgi:hypothetical protein
MSVLWTNVVLQRLAGGEHLGFNNSVFLSERESADRNYSLGFFMREYKCYPEKTNLRECMDFYFQVRRRRGHWRRQGCKLGTCTSPAPIGFIRNIGIRRK